MRARAMVGAFLVAAGLALGACGDDDDADDAAPAVTVTQTETTTDETTTGETTTGETTTDDDGGDDVSGNCDEAEHADDPECQ